MRNSEEWLPTKFEVRRGRLRASSAVSAGSVFVTELMATAYQEAIVGCARGNLADLGCGSAPLYCIYGELASNVVCVDWPGSLHSGRHVDVWQDLNRPLVFADESFDVVLLSDVLEHIYSPKEFLREAARVLMPGGEIVIGVPFLYWVHEAPHDYFRYTEFCLKRMLDEAGFELVRVRRVGGAFEVLADVMLKATARLSKVLARIGARVAHVFSAGPVGAAIRGRTSGVMPLAYVLTARKRTDFSSGESA